MKKENRLIARIQSGDQKAIEEVYTQFKLDFVAYASRFTIAEADVIDIYQDSVVVLYENILSGKLTSLTSSLKTYLFAIGKYKIFNSLKMKVNTVDLGDYGTIIAESNNDDHRLREESIEKLERAYQQLGNQCQEVIKLFYYENQNIEAIKNRLGYTSKDVVKSQKSRCIKQLKEILLKTK